MIRKLQVSDYDELLHLGQGFLNVNLKFSHDRARQALERVTSNASCYAMGEFVDGKMVSAVIVQSNHNTIYEKQHASLVLWLGSPAILKSGIDWAMARPAVRCFTIIFDVPVRDEVYDLLYRWGFDNSLAVLTKWK